MVLSTLFETEGCVCVCVCVCMCDGGKGRKEGILLFSRVRCSIPPPRKSDFEGSAQAHFQRSGLVIALTKRGGNFFLSALDKQYFITNLK